MRRRRWIGLVGGVVAARGVPASSLPDTAARAVQQEEQEFPLIIANMPATGQQKAVAVGVAVILIVTAAVIAPFAHIQLRPIDAFIPVLQTSLFVVGTPTSSSARSVCRPCVLFSRSQADTYAADRSHFCRRWPFRAGMRRPG